MKITNPVTHCSTLFTIAGIRICTFWNKGLNFTAIELSWALPPWLETRDAQKNKNKQVLKMKSCEMYCGLHNCYKRN